MKQDPFAGVYRARTPKELAEMFMNPHAPKTEAEHWAVREIEKLRAEVERLRADAERFRWLSKQTNMRIVTDGTVWRHGGGKKSFISWGYIFVNSRGYPGAPTLADLVDVARTDQEGGR